MPSISTTMVTGAASGIGQAIAIRAAQDGHRVACVDIRDQTDTLDRIQATNGKATGHAFNLRDAEAVRKLFADVEDSYGGPDILINSAAIFERGTLETTTEELWDRHLAINLKAPFLLCQAFARQMEPDRHGHIINIAD